MERKTIGDLRRELNITDAIVPSCPSAISPFILQNHQLLISKYLKSNNDSVLLWHGLGSGKTITSIAAALEIGTIVHVIAPAALIDNYRQELTNYTTQLLMFKNLTHPGSAISTANRLINKFKDTRMNHEWIKGFIENVIIEVGNNRIKSADIIRDTFKLLDAPVIPQDEPSYQEVLTKLLHPTSGGTKRRSKKYRNRTRRGGANKTPMDINGIRFNFLTSNGDLNQLGVFDRIPKVEGQVIIIDESQLFISTLEIKDSALTDRTELAERGYINKDEYKAYIDAIYTKERKHGVGRAITRSDRIYDKLMSLGSGNDRTRIILLSATPIVKNKMEIAVFINIVSGEERMACNHSVFEHNFGIITPTDDYRYEMTNAERKTNIDLKIAARIKNEEEFIRECSGCISYFGNIEAMMPRLIFPNLPSGMPHKQIFNNNGFPFINILECPIPVTQLAYIKYLEHVCNTYPVFGILKPHMYDYTFLLDSPEELPPPPDRAYIDRESGFFTDRSLGVAAAKQAFLGSFQARLVSVATPAHVAQYVANYARGKSDQRVVIPDDMGLVLDQNIKLRELSIKLLANPDSRHVIYVNSRYAAIMVGQMLESLPGLGYMEIKTEVTLGIIRGEMAAMAAHAPEGTRYFAYLRGETVDKSDDEKLLKYQENEGLSVDKTMMINFFNNIQNDASFKILVINNAVAEGITLKRVDFMHMISCPYDVSKMQQVAARIHRNCTHPEGGEITPYIYVTTTNHILPDELRAECRTIHDVNTGWQNYVREPDFNVPNYEIEHLVNIINKNDELLPYLRILRELSIEMTPGALGPAAVEPAALGPIVPAAGPRRSPRKARGGSKKYSVRFTKN